MGSVRSENGVKQSIVPLTDFKQKREPVVSNTIYLDTPIVNIAQDFVASNPICYDIHGKLVSERESDDERLVAQQESGDKKLVDGGESGGREDCVRKLVVNESVDKNTIILVTVKQKIASGSAQDFIAPHLICSNFHRKLVEEDSEVAPYPMFSEAGEKLGDREADARELFDGGESGGREDCIKNWLMEDQVMGQPPSRRHYQAT